MSLTPWEFETRLAAERDDADPAGVLTEWKKYAVAALRLVLSSDSDQLGGHAMTDPKIEMEVPLQIREFAKKSVDQTEKAISTFIASASRSVALLPGPMTDLAKQTLTITELNLKASFEHARKLIQAKDINEVMRLQSEFLRTQFAAATEPHELSGKSAAKDVSDKNPE
jgi:phasin